MVVVSSISVHQATCFDLILIFSIECNEIIDPNVLINCKTLGRFQLRSGQSINSYDHPGRKPHVIVVGDSSRQPSALQREIELVLDSGPGARRSST